MKTAHTHFRKEKKKYIYIYIHPCTFVFFLFSVSEINTPREQYLVAQLGVGFLTLATFLRF